MARTEEDQEKDLGHQVYTDLRKRYRQNLGESVWLMTAEHTY